MSEIRFRAWNNSTKKMITKDRFLHLELDGQLNWFTGKDGQPIDASDLIIMQYTGLKDKHGKEIYEGDIMDYFWKGGNSYQNLKVKDLVTCGMLIQDGFEFEKAEVIGNIYENKDLLK